MKQTITILTALAAALLVASGFIVAANIDLCADVAERDRALLEARSKLADQERTLEMRTKESKDAAETLRKTMEERDALSKQLNDAVLASQEANDAVAQQVNRYEKTLLELKSLTAEYEDLSKACQSLEAQLLDLGETTAQAVAGYEAQSLKDAQRIAELEKELAAALADKAEQEIQPEETTSVRPELPPAA